MNRWYWVTVEGFKDVRFLVSADSSQSAKDQVAFPDQSRTVELADMMSINAALGTQSCGRRIGRRGPIGDLVWNRDGETTVLKQPR